MKLAPVPPIKVKRCTNAPFRHFRLASPFSRPCAVHVAIRKLKQGYFCIFTHSLFLSLTFSKHGIWNRELRKLRILRERFRRSCDGRGRGEGASSAVVPTTTPTLREVVAPYDIRSCGGEAENGGESEGIGVLEPQGSWRSGSLFARAFPRSSEFLP